MVSYFPGQLLIPPRGPGREYATDMSDDWQDTWFAFGTSCRMSTNTQFTSANFEGTPSASKQRREQLGQMGRAEQFLETFKLWS